MRPTTKTGEPVSPPELPRARWLSSARPVVEPGLFAAEVGALRAVLCFTEAFYRLLVDAFGLGREAKAPTLAGAFEGRADGEVAVYRSYFGAPAAGMLMESLIASGVRQFVVAGEAGSISPNCRIGDILLPTWGVREEGTSYHYLPPEAPCAASPALLDGLRRALEGVPFVQGGVWTTDAPFRETADKVRDYALRGVLAVEMECTALMAIAACRRVEFAAGLVVTDELGGGNWVQGFGSPEVRRRREVLCARLPGAFPGPARAGEGLTRRK